MRAGLGLLVTGLLAGLAGCDSAQSTTQLHAYLRAAQAPQTTTIAAIPEVQPRKALAYGAMALRSPFQASDEGNTGSWQPSQADGASEIDRVRAFLEEVELARFEMVGTLSNDLRISVLLRANGAIHRLEQGDYLGRNNGRIASIDATGVEVFELISDGRGGWMERTLTIPLKQQS